MSKCCIILRQNNQGISLAQLVAAGFFASLYDSFRILIFNEDEHHANFEILRLAPGEDIVVPFLLFLEVEDPEHESIVALRQQIRDLDAGCKLIELTKEGQDFVSCRSSAMEELPEKAKRRRIAEEISFEEAKNLLLIATFFARNRNDKHLEELLSRCETLLGNVSDWHDLIMDIYIQSHRENCSEAFLGYYFQSLVTGSMPIAS